MFVCVVSLSQMLSVKCLCVLSRYLRCYMLIVCVCVVSLSQMLSVKCLGVWSVFSDVICHMFVCFVSLFQMLSVKCLCVCCLVISDVIC